MHTKIHDILDSAVSKWVGHTAHILAYLFNSASGQHLEVWASEFPFPHNLKDALPSSEACLYSHISKSLAQAEQQSSLGLAQALNCMRGCRSKSKMGSGLMCKKTLQESRDASFVRKS